MERTKEIRKKRKELTKLGKEFETNGLWAKQYKYKKYSSVGSFSFKINRIEEIGITNTNSKPFELTTRGELILALEIEEALMNLPYGSNKISGEIMGYEWEIDAGSSSIRLLFSKERIGYLIEQVNNTYNKIYIISDDKGKFCSSFDLK